MSNGKRPVGSASSAKKVSSKSVLALASAGVVIGLLSYYLYSQYLPQSTSQEESKPDLVIDTPTTQSSSEITSPVPVPTPTPLPGGIQTYNFTHGSEVKGPKIQTVTFSPLVTKEGSTQKITMTVLSDTPLTTSKLIITTDHEEHPINLSTSTSKDNSYELEASWDFNDTINESYSFRYILGNSEATYDNTQYLR